jgi:hypothetical protein
MTNTPIDTPRTMCIIGSENTRCKMTTCAKRHRLQVAETETQFPFWDGRMWASHLYRLMPCQKGFLFT